MSLADFQRAFADLIASPQRCVKARRDSNSAFAEYDLTSLELRRLDAMVRDEAMSTNCTLYRVNRLTPIYSVLPLSCRLLGQYLNAELEGFWAASRDATLQYGWEAWRFGIWIQERIDSGLLSGGPVEDAVRFELAAYDVQSAPRDVEDDATHSHPRKRLIQLKYDPERLLDPNIDPDTLVPLPAAVWVLLDATGKSLEVSRVAKTSPQPDLLSQPGSDCHRPRG